MPNLGPYSKFISALIVGVIGWATLVVNSASASITSSEWIVLVTAVAAALGVGIVPNASASDPR